MKTIGFPPTGIFTTPTPPVDPLHIALVQAWHNLYIPRLKNDVLFYDSVVFDPASIPFLELPTKTVQTMFDSGLLIDTFISNDPNSEFFFSQDKYEQEYMKTGQDFGTQLRAFSDTIPIITPESSSIEQLQEVMLRSSALLLNKYIDCNFVPILSIPPPANSEKIQTRGDVYLALLRMVPTLDNKTPWEAIVEFKYDKNTKPQLDRLKNWATFAAKENLTHAQLGDYIQNELNSYREHMELHELKVSTGTLQTIIVGGANILDNIVRIKFKPIAEALFAVESENVALLEAELEAPGRDLAFIVNAQDTFS